MQNHRNAKRPVIDLPITTIELILELIGILTIFTTFVLLSKYWHVLPDIIPTHFGVSGKPDGWGAKKSLLTLPVLGTFMYIGMWVLSKYPHIYNYPVKITEKNAADQYLIGREMINYIRTLVVLLFGYMEWVTIQTALGNSTGVGSWFIGVLLFFSFAPAIVYLFKSLKYK